MDPLTWSATRARTFQECRRKYYYRYVLAPQARRAGAPPEAGQAARVKDLIGLEAWCGDVVHQALRHVLDCWRVRRECPEEAALAHAARALSRQFRDSRAFWTETPEAFPYRPTLLDLHYYGEGELSRERAALLKERVLTSVRTFFRSPVAARIRELGPACWLPIDRNAAARLEDGVLILVRPDFAYRDGEELHILDWKTGRAEPFWEEVQLTCYTLYAAEKWRCAVEQVRPQIVGLFPELYHTGLDHSVVSLERTRAYIRESGQVMLETVGTDERPAAERFAYAEDGGSCRWCQFRGLCPGCRT